MCEQLVLPSIACYDYMFPHLPPAGVRLMHNGDEIENHSFLRFGDVGTRGVGRTPGMGGLDRSLVCVSTLR